MPSLLQILLALAAAGCVTPWLCDRWEARADRKDAEAWRRYTAGGQR